MSNRLITWGIVGLLGALFIYWQYSNYAHNSQLNNDLGNPSSIPARVAAARELIQKKQFGDVLPTTQEEVHGRVIDALALLCKDPDKDVATEALNQLVSLMKDPDEDVRAKAQKFLIALGPTAIPGVVSALGDADAHARKGAIAVLDAIGAPSIPALVSAVQKQAGQRAAAVDALVALAPRPNGAMLKLLSDKDKDVRSAAATYFGNSHQAIAEAQLLALLQDKDVRPAAIRAEGLLADPRALPQIEKALTDPADAGNRRTAIVALGDMRAISSIPLIVPFLNDGDPDIRSVAVVALRSMGAAGLPLLAQGWSGNALTRTGIAEALQPLTGALSPEALSLLTRALQDPSPDVREAAATSLGVPNDAPAVAPLISALADPSPDVAEAAESSLAEIGQPAIAPLVSVFANAGANPAAAGVVKPYYASRALIAIGAPAVESIIAAAQNGPVQGREWALVTLADLRAPQAVPVLQSIATSGPQALRWYAQDALRHYQA